MNFLKQSVAAKINGLVLVYAFASLLIAAYGLSQWNSSLNGYNQLLEMEVEAANDLSEVSVMFKSQVQEWKNVLLRGRQTTNREKYWAKFEAAEERVTVAAKRLVERLDDPALISEVRSFINEHEELGKKYRTGFKAFENSGYDPVDGDKQVQGIDRPATAQLASIHEKMVASYKHHADTIKSDSLGAMYKTMVVIPVASVLVIIFVVVVVRSKVTAPLVEVSRAIIDISSGKMNKPIDIKREDEIGQLASAAEKLRASLKDISSNIETTAQTVSTAADSFKSTAETIRSGTQDQHQRTDMVATAMEEMTAAAHEVARNASNAAAAAEEADRSAHNGSAVMQATIDTINTMAKEVENAAHVISKLEQDTNSVGSVLDVIRGIAEQTNLLALNAAIEAARAGEQGRGFAVVADEVRTLAMRTSESTAEIQEIIENVQSGARNAVSAIASGTEKTRDGVEQVGEAGRALESITSAVSEIRDMNGQIATAAEQQTSVSNEIAENITQIAHVADKNLRDITETASMAQGLVQNAGALREAVRRLTTGS